MNVVAVAAAILVGILFKVLLDKLFKFGAFLLCKQNVGVCVCAATLDNRDCWDSNGRSLAGCLGVLSMPRQRCFQLFDPQSWIQCVLYTTTFAVRGNITMSLSMTPDNNNLTSLL